MRTAHDLSVSLDSPPPFCPPKHTSGKYLPSRTVLQQHGATGHPCLSRKQWHPRVRGCVRVCVYNQKPFTYLTINHLTTNRTPCASYSTGISLRHLKGHVGGSNEEEDPGVHSSSHDPPFPLPKYSFSDPLLPHTASANTLPSPTWPRGAVGAHLGLLAVCTCSPAAVFLL